MSPPDNDSGFLDRQGTQCYAEIAAAQGVKPRSRMLQKIDLEAGGEVAWIFEIQRDSNYFAGVN